MCDRLEANRGGASSAPPSRSSNPSVGRGPPLPAGATYVPTPSHYYCYSLGLASGSPRLCFSSMNACRSDHTAESPVGFVRCQVIAPAANQFPANGAVPPTVEPADGTTCYVRTRGRDIGSERCFASIADCWQAIYADPSGPRDPSGCRQHTQCPSGFCCTSLPMWRGSRVVGYTVPQCEPDNPEGCRARVETDHFDFPPGAPRPRFRRRAYCTEDSSGEVGGGTCYETIGPCTRLAASFRRHPGAQPRHCRAYTPGEWSVIHTNDN